MNRKTLSAALAIVLTAGSLAFAQAVTAHKHDPHTQAVRMAKQLNLNPDQTAKLEPILADRDQKIAALRANTSLAPQDAKKQMRAIQQSTREQLSTVLTPDQLQQLKSMHHGHKGQAAPAAAPAPAA